MQKKLLASLAAIVLIASVGVMIWMRSTPSVDPTNKDKEEVPAEVSVNSVSSRAAIYIAQGEEDKAFEYFDEQIELTDNNRDKKSLLVKKAITAKDFGRHDEAIASAKQADEIESDTQTMRVLADAYAAKGDKEQALVYYRRLLALEKPVPDSEEIKPGVQFGPSVESIIKDLER